jgi:hypothetical protein
MLKKSFRSVFSILIVGFAMWVLAGLWHNLVLPVINKNVEAHHEGLFIMLIAYIILSCLMTYIYTVTKKEKLILTGVKIGIVIGILWVFPHGLTMAGAHDTSILYEIKNALWHCIEQGAGGILIALIKKDETFI